MAHGGVKIEVNLDKSKLQGSLKGLEGEMVKSMAIFEVMKQALTKVFGMITDSVDQAMRRIDTMDQFSRVMTTMTGSTDKANAALERTNAIVQGTAFGLDTAAKGVQAFVASGMEVSKATDTMEAWGDAVAFYTKGTNAELETVSAALQKMQTKGNVTMEHMQMMLEAGIPAIQIYASAVGKSTEEVTNQMSKGELKTEDFIVAMNGAFRAGTTGFPAIAGAAKQAGASWQGSQDNMKAAIARGTAAMLEQLDAVFDVKGGMVNFGKTMEKVLKTLAQNLDVILPLAVGVLGALMAFNGVKAVVAVFNSLKTAIGGVTTFFNTLRSATVAMKAGVEGAAESVKQMNAAMSATVVGAVIAGVVALMAVMDALSNRMDGYQKAFEGTIETAKAQSDANQQVLESMQALEVEQEKSTRTAEVAAKNQGQLVDKLFELDRALKDTNNTETQAAAIQSEMAQISTRLSGEVEGLSIEFDEVTGHIITSEEAMRKAIKAQEDYTKAVSEIDYARQQMESLVDVEVALMGTQDALAAAQEDMNTALGGATNGFQIIGRESKKGIQGIWDWIKGTKNLTDETENLTDEEKELKEQLEKQPSYWQAIIDKNLDIIQKQNDAGESIERLAVKYGVSVDEIQSWMDVHEDGLQAWETMHTTTLNDAGENIEQVAARWGTTAEAIQAVMDENGVSLQGWEDEQEKILEEWNNAVQANKDLVINGMKELPTEMEYSLDEMIDVMNANAEKYNAWRGKMVEVSSMLAPEVLSYLDQLGPGTSEILDEIIADTSGTKAAELNAAFSNVGTAAVNGLETKSPEVKAAGVGLMDSAGAGMTESNVPNEAAQAVADGVVYNLSNADYSAITTGMANAIKSGTNAVQSAAQSMATAVANVLQKLSTDARTEMTKTMTLMTSAINTGRATLTNAMTAAMTAVKTAATTVANTFNTIGELIITNIKSGIDGHASAMSSSITAVMNAAKSAANAANTGWENIGYNMVAGMASGVRNNESILTSAIRSVVNAAIKTAKDTAVIKSPSQAFRDQVGRMIPLGIAEGVRDETLAAVKSVKNMTNSLIAAGSASLTAKIAVANAGVGASAGSTQSFVQNNTIVRPPETPGQAYRALQRTGRQMIRQFGR